MVEKRSNNALNANPDVFHYPNHSDINITTHGSDVYWAITALMAFATICFVALSFRVPRSKRIFHYITAAITMTASVAYFTMASNLGYAAIIQEFQRNDPVVRGVYREIFYVRYIDWVVTTPVYWTCGGITMFLWFLYPIAWGLSEGGNVISGDSEAVFYGVLDVLAKIGFGIALLAGHRNIDPAATRIAY
ncbi:hypothetical protein DID88_007034 [Monilinia fructigena]|uniref:Opsin n=1 Tax=Monilinia fructigena TaxID=38457 RepID=A0A395J854_9HELO|nr:hypothetical protein DID88_007034 [Monilinia fructigena]